MAPRLGYVFRFVSSRCTCRREAFAQTLGRRSADYRSASVAAGTNAMGAPDASETSFIVKVWLETTQTASEPATWRGYVTHVASGRRRYARRLDDFPLIIMPYLQSMGVHFGAVWRIRRWLSDHHRFLRHRI
jgi:hypothetical protein